MPIRTNHEILLPPPWQVLSGVLAGLLDHVRYDFYMMGAMETATVTGFAKVDPAAWTGGARSLRDCLFDSAQRAIAEVEWAGYRHDAHPEIHITGDVDLRYGQLPELVRTKCFVEMRLLEPWKEQL